MKKIILFQSAIIISIICLNNCHAYAQGSNEIKASFVSMTVADPAGGRWIWGQSVSIGDTVSIPLQGDTNTYYTPWCTSFECCNSGSYNGMSVSLHTVIADSCYRIFVTGGLTGGVYFTDGFIVIPPEWIIDSVQNASSVAGTQAYDSVIGNRIVFHAGTDYGGCSCSDCGRANVNYYISRNLTLSAADNSLKKDLFTIFPNPAKDKITLENGSFNIGNSGMIFIYNIHSSLILQQMVRGAKTEIDISKLSKGVYIIHVINNHINQVQKFIKE